MEANTVTQPAEDFMRNELTDKVASIPEFPPRQLNEQGRLIPISLEEERARSEAAIRALEIISELSDDDPLDVEAEFMRGIDDNRPRGQKIFDGLGLY